MELKTWKKVGLWTAGLGVAFSINLWLSVPNYTLEERVAKIIASSMIFIGLGIEWVASYKEKKLKRE